MGGASSSARRYREERRAAAGIYNHGAAPSGAPYTQQNHAPYPLAAPPPSGLPQHYPATQAPVQSAPGEHVHKTTTVRNLVNVKKASLSLKPLPNHPHLLQVSFQFDAIAPCSVSVIAMGTEASRVGSVTSQGPLGPRVMFHKGMNQAFPPEGLANPELYCIDTSLYPVEQRQSADDSTGRYPLVIRLETLSLPGAPPASLVHDQLAAMPVGCAQSTRLQSQTTFAVLGDDSGTDVAKVLKQKIFVDDCSYELQEIYGLTEAASSTDGDADTVTECVVCLVAQKNTTVLPCRHFCMCNDCAKALLKRSRKCPMCRLNITSVLQIQIADRKPRVPAPAAAAGPAAPAPAASAPAMPAPFAGTLGSGGAPASGK